MLKVLDLCCKAGGMSMGYHQAGFDVTGVDIEPQPHYPFKFIQADAIKLDVEFLRQFDLISASPPCQAYTQLQRVTKKDYPRLIDPIRRLLIESGRLYVIENVPGAPLINSTMLCGTMFNLKVYRHRIFETNFWFMTPPHSSHKETVPKAGRGPSKNGFISVAGHFSGVKQAKIAMGIDWMNQSELAEAIPPAYSKFLGEQALEAIKCLTPYPVPTT